MPRILPPDPPARACRRIALIAAIALAAAIAPAQEPAPIDPDADSPEEELPVLRRYAVEMIIFENGSDVVSGNEIFLPEPLPEPQPVADGMQLQSGERADGSGADAMVPLAASGVPLPAEDSDVNPIEFDDDAEVQYEIDLNAPLEEFLGRDSIHWSLIDPEQYTMTGIYDRLVELDAYEPVLHSGWIQVAFDEAQTPSIRLRSLGVVPLRFEGELTLYLSRYLHLVVDLSLEDPALPADSYRPYASTEYGDSWSGFGYEEEPKSGPVIFRINENRIVADGDLRLYDHPKFGVLARITRLEDELQEPAIEAEPAATTSGTSSTAN